jgi:hypothetical protein
MSGRRDGQTTSASTISLARSIARLTETKVKGARCLKEAFSATQIGTIYLKGKIFSWQDAENGPKNMPLAVMVFIAALTHR